jgi:hypothetical protein
MWRTLSYMEGWSGHVCLVTTDGVWTGNRICWSAWHNAWLHCADHGYTHTHTHTHSSVRGLHHSFGNGFQRRTFHFFSVFELSPSLSHSNSLPTLNKYYLQLLMSYEDSKVKVILRQTVNRPVCLGVRHSSWTRDQFFFFFKIIFIQLRVCACAAPSPTRYRICSLQLKNPFSLPDYSILERTEQKTPFVIVSFRCPWTMLDFEAITQ